jgi:hypothetical protein
VREVFSIVVVCTVDSNVCWTESELWIWVLAAENIKNPYSLAAAGECDGFTCGEQMFTGSYHSWPWHGVAAQPHLCGLVVTVGCFYDGVLRAYAVAACYGLRIYIFLFLPVDSLFTVYVTVI